jgi:hypothetical protein
MDVAFAPFLAIALVAVIIVVGVLWLVFRER